MRFAVATLATLLLAAPAAGQATAPRVAPSSFATVAVHVSAWRFGDGWYADVLMGTPRIAISYGQPHARGRQVVGGLIPRDTVWRLGANLATTLETDVPLDLGGLAIPRGRYTLYLLYGGETWHLIVNRATSTIGAYDYTPAADLGRVRLTAAPLAEAVETLAIYLIPDARPGDDDPSVTGTLRITWGTTDLRVPWRIAEAGGM